MGTGQHILPTLYNYYLIHIIVTNDVSLQVGYFVGGVAPLESGEIAGIVGAFAVMAGIMVSVVIVFLLRKGRPCGDRSGPVLSTIWVRKQQNGNGGLNGQQQKQPPPSNGMANGHGGDSHTADHAVTNGGATTVVTATNNGVVVNGTAFAASTQAAQDQGSYEMTANGPDLLPNSRRRSVASSEEEFRSSSTYGHIHNYF